MALLSNDPITSNAKLYYKIARKEEVMIEFTSSLKSGEVLFKLSEYERLEVRFESGRNGKELKIESFQGDDEVLLTDNSVCLTEELAAQETSAIPGVYAIRLIDENQGEKSYFFEVTSHNLSVNQLELMKVALESRVAGITRDFNNQREVVVNRGGELLFSNEFAMLIKKHDELQQALDNIVNSPIEDLTKKHMLSDVSKKQSARSQRWLETKGQRYRENGVQTMFYEPRVVLDLDTIENKTLKHNLNEIMVVLMRVARQYRFNEGELVEQINRLKTDILNVKQQKRTLNDSYNIDRIKIQINNEIISKTKELEVLKKQRSATLDNQRKLRSLITKMSYVLDETWVKNVRTGYKTYLTNRAFKNPHYSFIYNLAQDLSPNKKKGNQTKVATFPFLETSKLFEFYNFILCIDLLEKEGFKWTKGWMKERQRDKHMLCSLNPGEELWFENPNGYKVQMTYDKFLNSTTTAKTQGVPQIVTATSRSRRPDIFLSIYDPNNRFVTSMVVEVKYRKIRHIYKEEAESDVLQQLLDYEYLRYYDPNQIPLFKPSVVSQVVVIYPEQKGATTFVDENYGYSFIPVEPVGFEQTTKGFSEVESVFKEFLSNCGQ